MNNDANDIVILNDLLNTLVNRNLTSFTQNKDNILPVTCTNSVNFENGISGSSKPSNWYDNQKINAIERHVFQLIKEGNLNQVTKLLEQYSDVDSSLLTKWTKIFRRSKNNKPDKKSLKHDEISNDSLWLKNNSKFYISKWVALKDGKFIGANENLNKLKEEINNKGELKKITYIKL